MWLNIHEEKKKNQKQNKEEADHRLKPLKGNGLIRHSISACLAKFAGTPSGMCQQTRGSPYPARDQDELATLEAVPRSITDGPSATGCTLHADLEVYNENGT